MTNEVIPLTEAKAKLSEYAERVETGHERVTVTRNGRRSFVMIAADDLEGLEETLELLSDPVAMREIREAMAEIERGETVPWEQVKAEMEQRRADDAVSS